MNDEVFRHADIADGDGLTNPAAIFEIILPHRVRLRCFINVIKRIYNAVFDSAARTEQQSYYKEEKKSFQASPPSHLHIWRVEI